MKKFYSSILVVVFSLLISISAVAQTDYESSANIQFLYGENFDPDDIDLFTITPQHSLSAGAFEYYGFVDLYYQTNTEDISAHLEWYPKINLSRNMNSDFLDILIGGGVNADFVEGENAWVWLAGPVWQFSVSGFESLQLETYYYKQVAPGNNYEGTYQITPSWDIILPEIGSLLFRFEGFVDFIGDRGPGVHQIITQPQFLIDIGNFWDDPGRIYGGTEWRYWYNKGGTEGITESVFQWELRIEL